MKKSVAYLLDPRFPGGTSSAVAQELRHTSKVVKVEVFGVSSHMFSGRNAAPQLDLAFEELGIDLVWDPVTISADVVIIQNPAFLKFDNTLPIKIVARKVIVVTHENFFRPGGHPSFDVKKTLKIIDRATFAGERILAPISPQNRKSVHSWMESDTTSQGWKVLRDDWFNICDFEILSPVSSPRDRRGRLSRPGQEKFPTLDKLQKCFPPEAEANLILGADNLLSFSEANPHWQLLPFGSISVAEFFYQIDFFVYFTSSTWRESFGRVIAEAIAAGKVVISDPDTAASFGAGVVSGNPISVSEIIQVFLENPTAYVDQVRKAQSVLAQYSGKNFLEMFFNLIGDK